MITPQPFPPLAMHSRKRYGLPVAANSATGRRNPISKRCDSAQITTAGVFFRLQLRVMAAVCGQTSVWPGSVYPGIPTPRTAATQSRRKDRGGSSQVNGATPMHALNPFALRAYVHRRLALTALRADTSLSTRLARYTHHINTARNLEPGGAQ